ncbi:MAG: hypothetical protein WCE21_03875 [Candidatus Babeliales bacterium]
MNQAERYFIHKQYSEAIYLYNSLLVQHRSYDHARKRVIQGCFALAKDTPNFYNNGLSFLQTDRGLTDPEIEDLAMYLPTDEQKNEFRSIFTTEVKA